MLHKAVQWYNKRSSDSIASSSSLADAWSFGVILFEMMALERPFRGDDFPELVRNVLQSDPPLIHIHTHIHTHDSSPDKPTVHHPHRASSGSTYR